MMVVGLGLNSIDMARFADLLARSHWIATHVQITDLNHNYLSDVSDRLLSGTVNIDASAEISRSLTIELLDPLRTMSVDSGSPDDGALYYDRMLHVTQDIIEPDFSWRVNVPLFWGPIRKLTRSYVVAKVECSGKEVLSSVNSWRMRTYAAKSRKTSVIRSILKDLCGETKLAIPDLAALTPNPVAITNDSNPWSVCTDLASSMGYMLFYDGRGYATMRPKSAVVVHTVDQSQLTSKPEIGFDLSNLVNAVKVVGAVPKGSKNPVSWTEYAPASHPLSGQSLARGGVPQYYGVIIQDDNVKTTADCRTRARNELTRGLVAAVEAQYTALPLPHLEEGDMIRVNTDEFTNNTILDKMSIPLVADADSTYGFLKRVRPNPGAIRSRR